MNIIGPDKCETQSNEAMNADEPEILTRVLKTETMYGENVNNDEAIEADVLGANVNTGDGIVVMNCEDDNEETVGDTVLSQNYDEKKQNTFP